MDQNEQIMQRRRSLVSALRSGQWPQTTGGLERLTPAVRYNAGFCCLGVACKVAMDDGAPVRREPQETHARYSTGDGDGENSSMSMLPTGVIEWYGFGSFDPELEIPREVYQEYPTLAAEAEERGIVHRPAALLNDSYKLTFAHIADCFEYTLLRDDWEASHGETAG